MEIGARIQRARMAKGLNQTQLGERLGVGQSTISQWERGTNNVGIEDIKKVARETGHNPVWLAFGDESGMSEEEAALLAAYRGMDRERRQAFLTMIGQSPGAPPERSKRPFAKRR